MNLLYIATNAASAILYHSIWSATLTAYHLTLIIIRLLLVFTGRPRPSEEEGRRLCLRIGVLLLLLDLASAAIMLYSVRQASYARYSGIILLGFLTFTVYSVTRSVVELRRHRESENHLYYAARNISLTTSLMSVFNLQYSVFSLLHADFLLSGRVIFLFGMAIFSINFLLSVRLMKRGK